MDSGKRIRLWRRKCHSKWWSGGRHATYVGSPWPNTHSHLPEKMHRLKRMYGFCLVRKAEEMPLAKERFTVYRDKKEGSLLFFRNTSVRIFCHSRRTLRRRCGPFNKTIDWQLLRTRPCRLFETLREGARLCVLFLQRLHLWRPSVECQLLLIHCVCWMSCGGHRHSIPGVQDVSD